MIKINRVLYAVISDIFEELIKENSNIEVDEVRARLYQVFDENLECVIEDFSRAANMSSLDTIDIAGEAYTKNAMITMITDGIDFESTNIRADSRGLISHLSKSLSDEFLIYPDHDCNVLIEHSNVVEAQLNFENGKIILMRGETPEPDVQVFKEVLPEILKWVQDYNQEAPASSTPNKPAKKKSRPSFDML
jgi:hypothetical protein